MIGLAALDDLDDLNVPDDLREPGELVLLGALVEAPEVAEGAPASSRASSAATASVRDYIDNFYSLKRRHSRLAYMSPIELELKTYVAARAA
ncbi:hypothetical protein WME99_00410 [Sorangium sp. So ce136]|uniref:hypothetical protein n=1 Tax=Sorangium sp. So ce136 TaxID=3133284 RepID=UPI003F077A1B